MTAHEAEEYFDKLSAAEGRWFNCLVKIGLILGKPTEGAYSYAKTVMEASPPHPQ